MTHPTAQCPSLYPSVSVCIHTYPSVFAPPLPPLPDPPRPAPFRPTGRITLRILVDRYAYANYETAAHCPFSHGLQHCQFICPCQSPRPLCEPVFVGERRQRVSHNIEQRSRQAQASATRTHAGLCKNRPGRRPGRLVGSDWCRELVGIIFPAGGSGRK